MAYSETLLSAAARRRDTSKTQTTHQLIRIIVLLCLMSLLSLGQTGVVATRGYAVSDLEAQRTELVRERGLLHMRLAAAQSIERIQSHAEKIGLRPITREQVRYLTIVEAGELGTTDGQVGTSEAFFSTEPDQRASDHEPSSQPQAPTE